jgi:endonuclease-3
MEPIVDFPPTTDSPRAQQAAEVYRRLLLQQGPRAHLPRREPLRELISTMLSHHTTHADEELAYERMWQRFGSWEGIRDAPLAELTHAIRSARFPEVKAPNIKQVLARIIEQQGEATIDFLADLSAQEGMRYLTSLPGVGLKTASLVLLFCFAKPVMPVDTHVHRVSGRLGLIVPKESAEAAHRTLAALLPPDPYVLYNFHVAMLRHGQRICVWGTPRCDQCVLADVCDYFRRERQATG